jgi:hypothetical protein
MVSVSVQKIDKSMSLCCWFSIVNHVFAKAEPLFVQPISQCSGFVRLNINYITAVSGQS